MAGALTISTLNDDTGVLAVRNGMTGIAKAWVNYNGVTQTIRGSFNVSSVTYSSTGRYIVNFTTAMPNTNYCGTGTVGGSSSNDATTVRVPDDGNSLATGSCPIGVARPTVAYINSDTVNVAFFSS
jgi:small ligand-binding sensory domain FIST